MLSVHRLAAGAEEYYLDQVVAGVEDYYAGVGEAPGEWMASSHLLGLSGRVDPDDLRAVLLGRDPATGVPLHHGTGRSVPGWDLTFRAPKSVSVLWGLSDPALSEVVVEAHQAAVAAGLDYMERFACFTRTGRGGVNRVAGDGLIAAGFRHRTSRDGDPHLHTHVLVANSVRAADGKWRTIDGRGVLAHMKTAGYIYDAQLRHELTSRLGVTWRPVVNGLADIDTVSPDMCAVFSKRRATIEDRLAEWGLSSARAAETAALDTRRPKPARAEHEDELRTRWRSEAAEHGWPHERITARVAFERVPEGGTDVAVVAPDYAIEALASGLFDEMSGPGGLTARASTFDRRNVIQHLVDRLPAGPPSAWFEEAADRYLVRPEVIRVDVDRVTGERYSTAELLALEQRLVDQIASRTEDPDSPWVPPSISMSTGDERSSLSDEQYALVNEVCCWADGVSVIAAGPGTGKTFCLDTIRDAFQRIGFHVMGCALSASAAHELTRGSGIDATTIALLQRHLETGDAYLDSKTVLVVDEAGMVGTRALAPLLDRAERVRAKVVLVGDPRQLPEIDAGGLLRHLAQHHDVHTLTHNRRQQVDWERHVARDLGAGRVEAALDRMAHHGGIVVGHNTDVVRDRMTIDWFDHRRNGETAVMLAIRNADVDDLNRRAHRLMANAGHLAGEPLVLAERPFQVGDRIVCLRNDRRLGVRNGTTGDITGIDHAQRTVTVATDDWPRQLPARYLDAGHVRHGYALTIHKAQGVTADHSLVLGTDDLYLEAGYVGVSRGRHSNRIYAVSSEPDPDAWIPPHLRIERDPIDSLTDSLNHSRSQTLGIDHPGGAKGPDHDVGIDL